MGFFFCRVHVLVYPEYIRLGFGGATTALKEGLSRLSKFLMTQIA